MDRLENFGALVQVAHGRADIAMTHQVGDLRDRRAAIEHQVGERMPSGVDRSARWERDAGLPRQTLNLRAQRVGR